MEDKIVLALEQTLNPDATIRREAEAFIAQSSSQSGFLVILMKLIVRSDIPNHIQLSAAVQLKNGVHLNWNTTKNQMKDFAKTMKKQSIDQYAGNMRKFLIAENDKQVIRDNIAEAMARSQQANLRKTLGACVRYIAHDDFPHKWPMIVEQSINLIRSQDPSQMHAGLLIIEKIFKKYQYISRSDKDEKKKKLVESMFALIDVSFPLIRSLGEALLPVEEAYVPELLKICCKIFYKGNHRVVSPYINQPAELEGWSKLVVGIMQRRIPNMTQEDSWWAAKRRAGSIMNDFLHNHSRVTKDERSPAFVEMIVGENGVVKQLFLPCVLNLLRQVYVEKHNCTNVVKMLCFSMIENSVDFATLFQVLKQNLQFLVESVFIDAVSWTQESLEEWQSDPEQFIMGIFSFGRFSEVKGMSLQDDAAHAFESLCRFRKRYVMPTVMGVMDSIIKEYQHNSSNLEIAIKKSGLLRLIQELSFLFKKDSSFQIESMLVQHVLPDLRSPFSFLRFASCRALSEYYDIKWSSPQQETAIAQVVVQLLYDKELPVQVEAVVCLDRMFKCATPAMDAVIIQMIPQLIKSFHSLSQQLGIDTIFGSLQTLIEKYPTHVRPYGIEICTSLASAFYKITMVDDREDDEEELDTAAAAGDCLNSLETMLASFAPVGEITEDNRNLLLATIPQMIPLFSLVFVGGTITEQDNGSPAYAVALELYNGQIPVSKNVDLMDYTEVCLNMLHRIVYHGKVVHPVFWKYLPLFNSLIDKTNDEYVLEIFSVIETMIHFDPDGFLQPGIGGTDQFQYILNMVRPTVEETVKKAMEGPDSQDDDDDDDYNDEDYNDDDFYLDGGEERGEQAAAHGAVIFSTMLQACAGKSKVDSYVNPILELIIPAANAPINDSWVVTNFLNVVQSAIFHNMELTLSILGPQGLLRVIALCHDYIESHTVLAEKLILLLAFTKIVTIPSSQVGTEFGQSKREIIQTIATLFTSINKLREELTKREQERKDKSVQHEIEKKPLFDHSDETRLMFLRQGPTDCPEDMNTFDFADNSYVEDPYQWNGDEPDEDEEEDVDDEYESPVDKLDEFVFFFNAFSKAGSDSQNEFQQILGSLSTDVQNIMSQVINEGNRRGGSN